MYVSSKPLSAISIHFMKTQMIIVFEVSQLNAGRYIDSLVFDSKLDVTILFYLSQIKSSKYCTLKIHFQICNYKAYFKLSLLRLFYY